jgi:hypothetical protein
MASVGQCPQTLFPSVGDLQAVAQASAVFVALAVPMQTPAPENRAEPWRPNAAFLYTGDDSSTASTLSDGLLLKPALKPSTLVTAQRYLDNFSSEMNNSAATLPGEFVSLLGMRLGTSSKIQAGLYLETAMIGVRQQQICGVCCMVLVAARSLTMQGFMLGNMA